jgi:hypothetical protein
MAFMSLLKSGVMAIGFTDFIKHNDKDIGLYIIQANPVSNELCFKVYVRSGVDTLTVLCMKLDGKWQIIPQDVPPLINELTPVLTSIIDKRILTVSGFQDTPPQLNNLKSMIIIKIEERLNNIILN